MPGRRSAVRARGPRGGGGGESPGEGRAEGSSGSGAGKGRQRRGRQPKRQGWGKEEESRRRGKEGGESCGGGCARRCVSRRRRKMRLKIGFILRSLLVVGSFVGLVVLWSSLSPRLDDPSPLIGRRVSDPPAPSGGGDLQLVLFARASGGSRGRRGRARRWRRSSAGGAGAAGAGRGRRAPRSPSPPPAAGPPPRRPFLPRFPAPGPAAAPRAAAAAAAAAAALHAGAAGRSGGRARRRCEAAARPFSPRPLSAGTAALAARGRGRVRAAACGAGRPGGGEMPPLPSPVRARPLGPPSLPPPRRPGAPQPGAPPAGPPARERERDGAPPPGLAESAASPSTPVARGRGATCGRGLARDRRVLSLPWPGEGRRRRGVAGRPAAASRLLQGIPLYPGGVALPALSGGRGAGAPSRAAAGLLGRKLTCARAPPLLAGRLLARPDAGGGGGVAERPAPPLGRICLPPKARVLALTLPCFGGFSQAPRNISYREPRREGPRRRRRLPGPRLASASSRTRSPPS